MKKNAFFLRMLPFLLAAMVFESCSKFLDDKPKTSLTTGNAYQTAADIEAALVGCYNLFLCLRLLSMGICDAQRCRSDNAYPGGNNEDFL